jgi:hydrogenase maturation protease
MDNKKVLIIGYGSPIRGDDAIGPLVADRLQNEVLPDGVDVISRHILTAELVADLVEHDRVVFLDAAVDGPPGEIRCRQLGPDAGAMSTMAHFLDPRELLAWCETLYGEVPETFLVSVCGASFEYSSYSLSSSAEAAIEPMLEWVRRLITERAPLEPFVTEGAAPRMAGLRIDTSSPP